MTATLNKLEKQFYSDGYKLAAHAVEAGLTRDALFSAIRNMYHSIDEFNSSFSGFAKNHDQKIDCTHGCEWCCYQPVFALNYELDYLKNFVVTRFDRQKQKAIQNRAGERKKKLDGLKKEEFLNSKFPCPLLEKSLCMAYEARPMACRIYLSTKLKTCLNFYKHPEDKNNYPALLSFPMRVGRMMNEGFKAALKTNGIKPEEFRIEEKLC